MPLKDLTEDLDPKLNYREQIQHVRDLKQTVAETSNGYVENSNIKMTHLGNQISNRLIDIKSFNQIDID